ncbi:12281_t:CDS:2 [Entrophospora sp. SA101]|nr:12281_t:CDS:2 [Entrophospora sp. SA101]CAJ0850535.1 17761_t:CDS:2 [Entrophospora sp. SA101]CAJ0908350.1 4761_t:CDS:2 [Entrophospora sp. SA101]
MSSSNKKCEDIIALIQPTEIEIDEQQDETFIPKISIIDTIIGVENLLNFLVYPPSDFDVCEDELKCIRTLRKKLLSHKPNLF